MTSAARFGTPAKWAAAKSIGNACQTGRLPDPKYISEFLILSITAARLLILQRDSGIPVSDSAKSSAVLFVPDICERRRQASTSFLFPSAAA